MPSGVELFEVDCTNGFGYHYGDFASGVTNGQPVAATTTAATLAPETSSTTPNQAERTAVQQAWTNLKTGQKSLPLGWDAKPSSNGLGLISARIQSGDLNAGILRGLTTYTNPDRSITSCTSTFTVTETPSTEDGRTFSAIDVKVTRSCTTEQQPESTTGLPAEEIDRP